MPVNLSVPFQNHFPLLPKEGARGRSQLVRVYPPWPLLRKDGNVTKEREKGGRSRCASNSPTPPSRRGAEYVSGN